MCEVCSVALYYCLSTNLDSWELLLPAQYAVSVSWSPHHLHRRKMDLTGALWTSAPGCPSHYIFTIYIPIFHSANGEHGAVLEVLILLKCKAERCLELQSYKCIFVEDIKLTLLTLFQFSDFFWNEMKMSWCTAKSISLRYILQNCFIFFSSEQNLFSVLFFYKVQIMYSWVVFFYMLERLLRSIYLSKKIFWPLRAYLLKNMEY